MKFTKMHGCGNDYVFVDCFNQSPLDDPATLSKRISDRHFGVGSDGLILILPSAKAAARMRMFNKDGSEGEMCGNGVRCFARFIYDRGYVDRRQFSVETASRIVELKIMHLSDPDYTICVDMGEPVLSARKIPVKLDVDQVIDYPTKGLISPRCGYHRSTVDLAMSGQLTCVSMGNPHAIFFIGSLENQTVADLGAYWSNHAIFPDRANVHFVDVVNENRLFIQTWERGSGPTLACGTGACAVVVAAAMTGRSNRQITAQIRGGELQLDWSETDNHVYMTGPAVEVFSGDWPD